jgi:hypothetical protein
MKNAIGLTGIGIALIGLCLAVFQDDLRPDPPSVSTQLRERVTVAISDLAGVQANRAESRDWVAVSYVALGLLALIAGVASFVRNENHRIAGMAGALGVVVIAWEYVLVGVIIAVVVFILANLNP